MKTTIKLGLFAPLIIFFSIVDSLFAGTTYNISIFNNPSPGVLSFNYSPLDNFNLVDNYGNNIAPNQGKQYSNAYKRLRNGTWISLAYKKYYIYNDNIDLIDSISNPTEFNLDFHDVEMLSNGHYLLLLNEVKTIDLSSVVEGGKTNAKVSVNILVETDRSGQIYWQWNILDHVNITDITDFYDLTVNNIDLAHINSIYEDTDGNLILSIRHFDEVAKINKQTGNFIWRLGGSKCKNNQFTFTNDTVDGFIGFSHQHTVSRLPNGNLLMFDNGNLKDTKYSRAVEYSINETQKTVTKVWEYRATPDIYQGMMGSVQRLENGNTLINWCQNSIMEVKPDKSIAFEINFEKAMIYRATKLITQMEYVGKNITNNQLYDFSNNKYNTGVQFDVSSSSGTGIVDLQKFNYSPKEAQYSDNSFTKVLPYRLVFSSDKISSLAGKIYLNVSKFLATTPPSKTTIYHRPKETQGIFQPLTTNYNPTTNEISATFDSMGEFVIVSHTLDIPKLIEPIMERVALPNDTINWESVYQATHYQIQIDNSKKFTNPIINEIITEQSRPFNFSNLYKIDSCYWRVRAISAKDTSDWSIIGRFSTVLPRPKLVFPNNDSLNIPVNVAFNWLEIEGAKSYNIVLSDDEKFENIVLANNVDANIANIADLIHFKKYYWKVQAVRSMDSSDWSDVWHFETIFATPTLSLPEHQKQNVEVNPNLIWLYDSTATKFQLQLALNGVFSDIVIDTIINQSNLKIKELTAKTQFYWRVRAIGENRYSNWTDYWSFTTTKGFELAKPTLISPANKSDAYNFGTIKWAKVNNASSYRFQLFQNNDYTHPEIDSIINKNEFYYSKLNYNSNYSWRIMALSLYSQSKWSDIWEFYTLPKSDFVKLKLPMNDDLQIPINCTLEWYEVSDINSYYLQVSQDDNFSTLIINNSTLKTNRFDLKNLELNTKYFWRVKFIDGITETKWSNTWYFTTETKNQLIKAELISPLEDALAISVNCNLVWNKVDKASSYEIAIATDNEFTKIIEKIDNISDTNYTINNLNYNQIYFWRVNAKNIDSQSPWSSSRSFLTVLKSPQIISPENNSIENNTDILIKWNNLDVVEYYELQIAKSKDFTVELVNYENIMADSIDLQIDSSITYFCRVKSYKNGNNSEWSDIIKFSTKAGSTVEFDDMKNLKIYPNPIDEVLFIDYEIPNQYYSIIDINGKVVKEGILSPKIDLPELSKGIYFLKINDAKLKFIKK